MSEFESVISWIVVVIVCSLNFALFLIVCAAENEREKQRKSFQNRCVLP